jgi:hypothetical protein
MRSDSMGLLRIIPSMVAALEMHAFKQLAYSVPEGSCWKYELAFDHGDSKGNSTDESQAHILEGGCTNYTDQQEAD